MNILKEMCIDTKYRMSIVEKVFFYEENEISVIKSKGEIWFRGKDIAKALGYSIPRKAIHEQKSAIFINESGMYSLILQSMLESAKAFKRWVTKDVLPSIRKTGKHDYSMNHKYNNMLTFKIENETDLHVKVIQFLKKRYTHSLFTVTLGENRCTSTMRIDSYKKGYLSGSPNLIINSLHKYYAGFAIEFKNPNGKGILSPDQSMMLRQYQSNGFKTLVSNDYDHIIEDILEYFKDVRMKYTFCPRKFVSPQSLKNHIKGFHKIT